MTLEEAIHYAEEFVTWLKDYKRLRELETQPCEQQSCDDAISRAEAIRIGKVAICNASKEDGKVDRY